MTTMRDCILRVSDATGVSLNDIMGDRRSKQLSQYRHLAMWLCRHMTACSMPQIGRAFNRDHSSVMHGIAKTERRIQHDPELAALAYTLRSDIPCRIPSLGIFRLCKRFEAVQ